ncbi:phosphoribosyltransferase [Nocardioides speluncae]|uniref:phosphoribosyltransferase n=1 Tax=Nocardioides speluncae TaxID=2670337 RepID=UPI00197D55DC|nr:phosphoribosyltransferase [Nocardioides speluncae]
MPPPPKTAWSGAWVSENTGIGATDHGLLPGLAMTDLFGMALRVNPRRPHLLVSTVLAKHVPTDPRVVRGSGLLLGLRVAELLGAVDKVDPEVFEELGTVLRSGTDPASFAARVDAGVAAVEAQPGLVFGYAETATALGHLVARALRMPSIHSTRRQVPGFESTLGFEESHSHATTHLVLPEDPALLSGTGPVVLVDDELTTGRTVLNTIREFQATAPRARYVIATLLDVRRPEDRAAMAAVADELGVAIDVVALAAGEVVVPDDVADRVAPLVEEVAQRPSRNQGALGGFETVAEQPPQPPRAWPWGVRIGGRHGFWPDDESQLDAAAADVAKGLEVGERVLVLGTEELMYAPLAIAHALRTDDREVRFSTTTRSPVRVLDVDSYAIRSGLTFGSHDNQADAGERFAYNVADGDWSDIVVVVDSPSYTQPLWAEGGLLDQLGGYADRVHTVVLPVADGLPPALHGPGFGAYDAAEVTWLLKDLSHAELEADIAVREKAIQAGEAHYAESLPVEYQPDESYQRLFHEQLAAVASRVATAVGAVAELSRRTRNRDDLVLVSLARAGTPIGILMRRWAQHQHGLDWPHYTISIVRDRGIDLIAMRYLAQRYEPERVLFVDGWTGKGAITREFAEAVALANEQLGLGERGFRPDLAVLADPGECVELFGTRDDFLIPSACLNSTVSGLVSRTVLNDTWIGPHDFHGAKFYAELAERDVSNLYLDAITAQYAATGAAAVARAEELLATDRRPTWVGWEAAERIRAAYGIPHINLVKPGVGETTRVLLRRVPWMVVVNPDRRDDLRHVELLANDRGVDVVPVEGLPYSCVGLIRPTENDG